MEFDMLAFTKQASIAMAATLGVMLSMPLSIPALSAAGDDDLLMSGPVVDFGLYYGPRIRFRPSKEGSTGDGTLLVSQIKRHGA
jgi:hypothetical protein